MPHASVCICVSEGGSRAGGEGLFEARPAARKPALKLRTRRTLVTTVCERLAPLSTDDARSEKSKCLGKEALLLELSAQLST